MSVKVKSARKSHDVLFMSLQMVFGLIAGVLIAAGWLALKPVTILDAPLPAGEKKENADRHEVTYVRGRPPGRGAQGARKQKQFLDRVPGEIVFAEEDVNRWLAGVYASKERTIRIEGIDLTMGPRVPSVRLVDDQMEIGLEIGLDRAGGNRTLVAQARGQFVNRSGGPVFVPQKIYLGSCPLPWNLGGRLLFEKLAALYPVSENVAASWSAVEGASVEKGRLRLVVAGAAPMAPAAVQPSAERQATAGPASVPAAFPEVTEPAAAPLSDGAPTEVPPAEAAPAATTEESPQPEMTAPEATTSAPMEEAPAAIDASSAAEPAPAETPAAPVTEEAPAEVGG